mgnify:CR=1 FL=1
MTVGVFGDLGTPSYAPGASGRDVERDAVPDPRTRGARDRWRMTPEARALTVVSGVLALIGLVVLFSASAITAMNEDKPPYAYFLKQAQGLLVGVVAFAVTAKLDAERWQRWAWWIMGGSLLMMLATVLPFPPFNTIIAPERNGSHRFLLGGSLQPAEFAKLAVIVWTPMMLVRKAAVLRRLGKGLGPFLVVIGLLSLFAMMQPDLSMAMTFCVLMAVILFAGGARTAHFVFLGLLAIPLLVQKVQDTPYLKRRVDSWLAGEAKTEKPASSVADQQNQSLVAIGSGQLLGVGFGEGQQQRGWVPLAYNDFIASVVGEEFGFVGIVSLIVAFAAYGWLGFRISRQARTPYLSLVALGLTYITVLTAFVHLGVAMDLLPNTGLTLPFISFGRSNLVLTMLMTGILVNIGSTRERTYGVDATDPFVASPA